MSKPYLVITEGPMGAGKSTLTNWIRENLPSTNLIRLAGNPDKTDETKTYIMYRKLMAYIKSMKDSGMNFVFDRMFFSEYVLCKLGAKEYDFEMPFSLLMRELDELSEFYNIIYINLELDSVEEYEVRLTRDKVDTYNISYSADYSMQQQHEYSLIATMLYGRYSNIIEINLNTNSEVWKSKIFKVIRGIKHE